MYGKPITPSNSAMFDQCQSEGTGTCLHIDFLCCMLFMIESLNKIFSANMCGHQSCNARMLLYLTFSDPIYPHQTINSS